MAALRPCLGCGALVKGASRCHACTRGVDRARGTREQRGYGMAHRRARAALATTLPAPCGYCGRTLTPGMAWVAAHVVDGDPSAGWVVACPACNERAKGGAGLRRGFEGRQTPAPSFPREIPA